jgi:hypothetical protein
MPSVPAEMPQAVPVHAATALAEEGGTIVAVVAVAQARGQHRSIDRPGEERADLLAAGIATDPHRC